ncbi:MAG TPA: RHS repeat-associated core domain-containing protein [Thermoanaerobaculia bacterium]|nr:RHS repeat-associated core domain-containing protein [Thermoanaerobaculia bacterium]
MAHRLGIVVMFAFIASPLSAQNPPPGCESDISLAQAPGHPGIVIMDDLHEPDGYSRMGYTVVEWKGGSRGFYPSYDPHEIYLDLGCLLEPEVLTVTPSKCGVPGRPHTITISPPNTQPTVSAETLPPFHDSIDIYFSMPNATGQRRIRVLLPDGTPTMNMSIGGTEFDGSTQASGAGTSGPVLIKAIACEAKYATDTVTVGGEKNCPIEPRECKECPGDPVNTGSENMRYEDVDPLPGYALRRTYDSRTNEVGFFGARWFSAFDARLVSFIDIDGLRYVTVTAPDRSWMMFEGSAGTYRQIGPGRERDARLVQLADGRWRQTLPGGREVREFNTAGRLIAIRDVGSGRETWFVWSGDLPARIEDSWGNWALNVITDTTTRRITEIAPEGRPDLAWRYTHDYQLLRVDAPLGVWRTYEYDMPHVASHLYRLTVARDGAGNVIEMHAYHNDSGRTLSSYGPRGEIDSFVSGSGRIAREMTSTIRYRNGRTEVHYKRRVAGQWRTVEISDTCGSCGERERAFVYDGWGNIIRVQGADGYITTHTYDGAGLRELSTTTAQRPETCDPATATDRCHLSVDALATVTLTATTATQAIAYAYEDTHWPDRVTRTTTASVLVPGQSRLESVTFHPANGEVLTRTVTGWTGIPARHETRITTTLFYDGTEGAAFAPGGAFATAWLSLPQPVRPKATDGARADVSDVATFVYYPIDPAVPAGLRGQLAATRNAHGHITRYEDYDAFGNARRVVDPNGVVTESTFDALGRRTGSTVRAVAGCDTTADPLCATDLTSTWTYSGAGPLATQRSPGGGVTATTYDARGRVATVSRGPAATDLRERIDTMYDPNNGNKSAERHLARENGAWVEKRGVSYAYNLAEELSSVTYAGNASVAYQYDPAGRITSQRDENHAAPNTLYAYDPAGRLREVKQKLGSGFAITTYGYDLHGNLTAVTDPNGNLTRYVYDDFGQLLRQESPVSGVTTYTYDATGNLLTTTDARGALTTRTYDALGRAVTSTSTVNGTTESQTWAFDSGTFGIGRLATMSDPTGSTSYSYDRRGLLRREEKTIGGAVYVTAYRHDADGNRSRLVYPSGRIVDFTHDYAGRPVGASSGTTALVQSASYLPFGPMTEIVFGNGTTRRMTHDARYRVSTNALTGPSGTLASYAYGYDAAGNVTRIDDTLDPRYNRTFAYDDLHRLTAANSGSALWGSGTYGYDAMGNLTALQLGSGRSATLAYDGTTPRLSSVVEDGITRTVLYDAAGNERQAGAAAYLYSPRNLLAGADELSFAYDGRGIRTTTFFDAAPLASLAVTPVSATSGTSLQGTVTLMGLAPSGGARVRLTASAGPVTLPETVTVPAGATSATFTIATQTSTVDRTIAVRAAYGREEVATVSLASSCPVQLDRLELTPASVTGGAAVTGTVILRAAAPAEHTLTLASSDSSIAGVPVSVLVPAGAMSVPFTIATSAVANRTVVTITAGSCGPVSAALAVTPPLDLSLSLDPAAIVGGGTTSATVSLTAPAPAGGVAVALASSDASIAALPSQVTIAGGTTAATVPVTTTIRTQDSSAVLTAAVNDTTASATLSVLRCGAAPALPSFASGEVIWWDDAPPAGASLFGDWNWDTTLYASGTKSLVDRTIAGAHEQWFDGAAATMATLASDRLFVYALLDPCNPPREVMLGWHAGHWPRVYWGEDLFPYSPRVRAGDLPPVGRWVRLEVPSYQAGIGAQTVNGMALSVREGRVWFDRAGKRACALPDAAPSLTFPADETVWFDDAPPPGAQLQGSWTWDTAVKASGTRSHVDPPAVQGAGHWFYGATSQITTGPNDSLFVYAYIDPCNPPREIMLGWHDGSWDHRAYWGEDLFSYSAARVRIGDVPQAGGWVKLSVPASTVQLSGRTIDGMAFDVYGGRVWFDRAGVTACTFPLPAAPTLGSADSIWIDDAPPAGASLYGSWSWDTSQKAGGTQSMAGPAWTGTREFYFTGASAPLQPATTDTLFVHMLIDPCAPPRQIMLGFNNGGWPRFYWGEDLFPYGPRTRMGDIPAAGQWVRLEVPASLLGATGQSIGGIAFSVHGGRVWFDLAGLESSGSSANAPMTSAVPAADAEPTLRRHSLYTPEAHLLAETELTTAPHPAVAYEYLWFNGEPAAQIETATSTIHWYFNDHLGTPLLTTNATATIDWRVEREPYGPIATTRTGLARHQPLSFPGQEHDPGTEVAYNIFRWYRAGWGRYTQADPIGLVGREYPYASNNPILHTDMLGLRDTGVALRRPVFRDVCTRGARGIAGAAGRALGLITMIFAASDANPVEFEEGRGECVVCDDEPRKCRPCIPPVGTIAYREDTNPRSRPHRGVPPPHWKLYKMSQNPLNCQCFWDDIPDNRGGFGPSPPPPGTVPITPAAGGGFW